MTEIAKPVDSESQKNPAQTWTQRVGKTLSTAEQFTADEVKTIATDAIEEELHHLPLSRFQSAPASTSYAEHMTPQRQLEHLLARASIECIKRFLGERGEQPER